MALIRAELKGDGRVTLSGSGSALGAATCGTYEGIVETAEDLTLPRLGDFDPGSMLYCLATGGVYVKTSQGAWTAV